MESLHKHIVVIGAGYGGITAALKLARLLRKHPDIRVHLVDRNPYHLLKTQLHESALQKTEVIIPMDRLIRKRNIIFHLDEVTRINPDAHIVYLRNGTLPFDFIVLALGSQTNFYGIPGLQEHAFTLEKLTDAQRINDHIARLCAKAPSESDEKQRRVLLRFIIGGGGLAGVELAAEFADQTVHCARRYHVSLDEVEIILIEAGNRIVPNLEESIAASVTKKLLDKKVKVLIDTKIVRQSADAVTLSSGEILETKTLVWTGGIRITDMFRESRIKIGQLGRIVVDEYLRAAGYPFLYAIGDDALAMNPRTGKPVPAAAQLALQQGRLVAANIYADVTGGEGKPYRPKVLGEVVSLGRHLAAGWLALPFGKKFTFIGFLGSLLKTAIKEKHLMLLRKESRNWLHPQT